MAMPGDDFGDNNFLWGTALQSAITSYVTGHGKPDSLLTVFLAVPSLNRVSMTCALES